MAEGARNGAEEPPVRWLTDAEVSSWLSVVRLTSWLPWSIDQQLRRDSNLGNSQNATCIKLDGGSVANSSESSRGQKLYARRGCTIEPFNEWFKSLFELHACVWHRHLDNNRTQLLAAIFAYQILLRYNRRAGNRDGRLQWILDFL